MAKRSYTNLLRRLAEVGISRDVVRCALLPDWWAKECADQMDLLPEVEIRVARFLGLPLAQVVDARAPLSLPPYREARMRRVRSVDRDRLRPALHVASRVADAVVRNLRAGLPPPSPPPSDGAAWRKAITRGQDRVTLDDIVTDLWERGIPVVPLSPLPSPGFQAMACMAGTRLVAMLGYRLDEPSRVAFLLAHEAAHMAAGDCAAGHPIVDGEDEPAEGSAGAEEDDADRYATALLAGSETIPVVAADSFRELATSAAQVEDDTGVDASLIIFEWARRTGDYPTARRAVKALYRHCGARRLVADALREHLDMNEASETDRELLRMAVGGVAE